MDEEKRKVACEKCIRAYELKSDVLGKHGEKCYWCLATIRNEEYLINLEKKNLKIVRELGRKERNRLTKEVLKPLEKSLKEHISNFQKRMILQALED